MGNAKHYITYTLLLLTGMLKWTSVSAQSTIIFDVSTYDYTKQVLLFNTTKSADSVKLLNKQGRALGQDDYFTSELYHEYGGHFTLFQADGSALLLDTGGFLYIRDNDDINAKPKPLNINIDTLGIGKENVFIEAISQNLEDLKIFVIPFNKYKISGEEPKVGTVITLKVEEIIYGAKNKVPPRILDLWKEQVKFEPEDRKILYNIKLILPPSMVAREGERVLMIYDLSHQVVAIYPSLDKELNVLPRENIMSNTYIYKLYFNEEEVKKGFIRFLSPEDEKKKLEEEKKAQETTPKTD